MTTNINNKILQLISLYEKEAQRSESLSMELESLKRENSEYKKQINDLSTQIEDLRLSNAFLLSGNSNEESKEILSKLIREIDNCIKLLEN